MKIAFIYPPQRHKQFEEDIDIVSREFGVFPPLGLLYAAAINEREGNESIIIDANAEKLSKEQVLKAIKEKKPDMLGFLLTAYGFFDAYDWIKFLKKATSLPVVAGNVLCEMYPNIVLSYPEIDYIIIGPATYSFPKFLERWKNGRDLDCIPGVGWKKNGNMIISKPLTMIEDFDNLPFPARHLIKNEKYHAVMAKRKNYTIMVTGKGCKSQCVFCHIHGIPKSFRSEESVVAEIEECHDRYGIREMDIFDPSFTMSRERVLKICRGIIDKNLDIHWACRTRVDQVDEELLYYMHKSGCVRILYGIESGLDDNLRKMKKDITVKQAKKAVEMTKRSGIMALGFFMLGVPGETEASLYETINYSCGLGLDYAQYHRTMAKPNTELNRKINERLGYNYWEEYLKGRITEQRLPMPWTDVSDKIIQRATKRAYLKFYFRPRYFINLILGIRSWGEFKRYVRSALGLLMSRRDI